MILRNWINMLNPVDGYIALKGTGGQLPTKDSYKAKANTSLSRVGYADNYNDDATSTGYNDPLIFAVAIGSGDTPPTVDDYKLQNAITANLNAGQTSISAGTSYSGASSMVLTQPIINNNSEAITVREVGIFTYGYNFGGIRALLTRDVINPVTIQPGERKVFVVSIDFTQMSTTASSS